MSSTSTPLTLIGVCMLFLGMAIASPNAAVIRQRLSQAVIVTCMALAFDWVAFVPGPRE